MKKNTILLGLFLAFTFGSVTQLEAIISRSQLSAELQAPWIWLYKKSTGKPISPELQKAAKAGAKKMGYSLAGLVAARGIYTFGIRPRIQQARREKEKARIREEKEKIKREFEEKKSRQELNSEINRKKLEILEANADLRIKESDKAAAVMILNLASESLKTSPTYLKTKKEKVKLEEEIKTINSNLKELKDKLSSLELKKELASVE